MDTPDPTDTNSTAKKLVTQRALLISLGTFLLGIVGNILAVMIFDYWWVFAIAVMLAFFMAMVIPADGILRRHPDGAALWVRLLAVVMLAAYPFVLKACLTRQHNLATMLIPAICLWLTSSILLYSSTRSEFSDTAICSAMWAVGMAILLVGEALLLGGDTLFGVASLLFGVASLLGGDTLFGVAFLLLGVAFLLPSRRSQVKTTIQRVRAALARRPGAKR
ncbi:MAG: hypothetical protein LBP68_07895 [Acidobacteriota bacterium]|nr:hypothetical protein [Acidobacteriota bacterium]